MACQLMGISTTSTYPILDIVVDAFRSIIGKAFIWWTLFAPLLSGI
jgi:hypothetical protein